MAVHTHGYGTTEAAPRCNASDRILVHTRRLSRPPNIPIVSLAAAYHSDPAAGGDSRRVYPSPPPAPLIFQHEQPLRHAAGPLFSPPLSTQEAVLVPSPLHAGGEMFYLYSAAASARASDAESTPLASAPRRARADPRRGPLAEHPSAGRGRPLAATRPTRSQGVGRRLGALRRGRDGWTKSRERPRETRRVGGRRHGPVCGAGAICD